MEYTVQRTLQNLINQDHVKQINSKHDRNIKLQGPKVVILQQKSSLQCHSLLLLQKDSTQKLLTQRFGIKHKGFEQKDKVRRIREAFLIFEVSFLQKCMHHRVFTEVIQLGHDH